MHRIVWRPFRHFHPDQRIRLVLVGLGSFYVTFVTWLVFTGGFLTLFGWDFPSFFASARIAVTEGWARVYDLAVQREVQQSLMAPYTSEEVETAPTFYLPVFVVPFCLLLPLGLEGGFAIWTLVNLIVLIGYLRWLWDAFSRSQVENRAGRLALALTILSLPVFMNIFSGQVSTWLLVCVGEFLRAWEQGKSLRGGLWLGGLLLKPQALILTLPFLLLSGEWSILAGFLVAATAIGAISLALAGPEGLGAWLDLLIRYTGDLPTINPQMMPNIRMVGTILSLLFPSDVLQWITLGLSGGIAVFVLARSLHIKKRVSGEKSGVLLVLMAATSIIAWHAHIHLATILIPPMLRQAARGRLSLRFLALWTILPPAGLLGGMIITLLFIYLTHQLPPIPALTCSAIILFAFHLYIAVRGSCSTEQPF